MTTLQRHVPSAGAVRPGASWPGWAGYVPTVRGPEARRARAQAAGILEPAPAATSVAAEAGPAAERGCERRRRPQPARATALA